ncbi:hypothetical protein SAMN05421664_3845, partial [Chryseobacterium soldanellicola]
NSNNSPNRLFSQTPVNSGNLSLGISKYPPVGNKIGLF